MYLIGRKFKLKSCFCKEQIGKELVDVAWDKIGVLVGYECGTTYLDFPKSTIEINNLDFRTYFELAD